MKQPLLKSILECTTDPFIEEVAALSLNELAALRSEIPDLIKEHVPEGGGEEYRRACQLNWRFRVVSLLGATAAELPEEVECLHRSYYCLEAFAQTLAQLIPRVQWPHAEEFARLCLPDDYPVEWVVPFHLVKSELIPPPTYPEWLMWMPVGFNDLASEKARDVSGVQLLKDEPLILDMVERFFADPMSGSLASVYCGSMRNIVGIGDKPPKQKELQSENDWKHFSLYCIGVSMIGLAREGVRTEEEVREMFFRSLAFVKNTQSARWLTGLIDLVCDNEQLAARESSEENQQSLRTLASHKVAALSKWSLTRLGKLAKKGLYPLGTFAATLTPVVNELPKTLAKSSLKAMSARLKKDRDGVDQVELAAKAALEFDDSLVTDLAEALLEQCQA